MVCELRQFISEKEREVSLAMEKSGFDKAMEIVEDLFVLESSPGLNGQI